MTPFHKLTRHDGVPVTVNMALVRYLHPQGDKTQIYFAKDDVLSVKESYQQIADAVAAAK
jgi:hypothetical protein